LTPIAFAGGYCHPRSASSQATVSLVIASGSSACEASHAVRCEDMTAMKYWQPPKGLAALAGMSLATLAILIAVAVVLCPS
jgi:hypothetical protein